jgi:hypothetical protein
MSRANERASQGDAEAHNDSRSEKRGRQQQKTRGEIRRIGHQKGQRRQQQSAPGAALAEKGGQEKNRPEHTWGLISNPAAHFIFEIDVHVRIGKHAVEKW